MRLHFCSFIIVVALSLNSAFGALVTMSGTVLNAGTTNAISIRIVEITPSYAQGPTGFDPGSPGPGATGSFGPTGNVIDSHTFAVQWKGPNDSTFDDSLSTRVTAAQSPGSSMFFVIYPGGTNTSTNANFTINVNSQATVSPPINLTITQEDASGAILQTAPLVLTAGGSASATFRMSGGPRTYKYRVLAESKYISDGGTGAVLSRQIQVFFETYVFVNGSTDQTRNTYISGNNPSVTDIVFNPLPYTQPPTTNNINPAGGSTNIIVTVPGTQPNRPTNDLNQASGGTAGPTTTNTSVLLYAGFSGLLQVLTESRDIQSASKLHLSSMDSKLSGVTGLLMEANSKLGSLTNQLATNTVKYDTNGFWEKLLPARQQASDNYASAKSDLDTINSSLGYSDAGTMAGGVYTETGFTFPTVSILGHTYSLDPFGRVAGFSEGVAVIRNVIIWALSLGYLIYAFTCLETAVYGAMNTPGVIVNGQGALPVVGSGVGVVNGTLIIAALVVLIGTVVGVIVSVAGASVISSGGKFTNDIFQFANLFFPVGFAITVALATLIIKVICLFGATAIASYIKITSI